jgi:hypothetical protein
MSKATRRRFLTQSAIGMAGLGAAGFVLRPNVQPNAFQLKDYPTRAWFCSCSN